MTEKQSELLQKLADVLDEVGEEAINDDTFNDTISKLNGFTRSIDEIASELKTLGGELK